MYLCISSECILGTYWHLITSVKEQHLFLRNLAVDSRRANLVQSFELPWLPWHCWLGDKKGIQSTETYPTYSQRCLI